MQFVVKDSVVFLGAVVLCSVLLPLALPVYRRLGLVDRPNARSSHTRAVPRGTGLVVVFSFLVALVAYSFAAPIPPLGAHDKMDAVLWAVLLLVSMGFIDDVRSVPTSIKFIMQTGSALILVITGFVFPLPDAVGSVFGEYRAPIEGVLSILWIVGVINAVNFIDGSDGLAATLSVLCMLIFVGLSRILPTALAEHADAARITSAINVLGLAGIGAAVPFLLYNVHPAKCFLGDAGSTFFGLLLAVMGILVAQYHPIHVEVAAASETAGAVGGNTGFIGGFIVVPALVLLIPVGDAVRVSFDRLLRGRSPFHPDNRHLHHLLHRAGLSPNQILFLVGLSVAACGMMAATLVRSGHSPYLIVGTLLLVVYGLVWFVKSSYRARRFVTIALNRKLLHFIEVTEGYENAASFKERFEQELARARRHETYLSSVVVNATALKKHSKVANPLENPRFLDNILRSLRREDIKCRFSNDRLAFLLVETDGELASHVSERLHALFDAIRNGESANLQVGIGVASYPDDGLTVTALLQSAETRAVFDMSEPRAMAEPTIVVAPAGGNGTADRVVDRRIAAPQNEIGSDAGEPVIGDSVVGRGVFQGDPEAAQEIAAATRSAQAAAASLRRDGRLPSRTRRN